MNWLLEQVVDLLPLAGTIVVVTIVLLLANRLLEKRAVATEGRRIGNQLIMAVLTLVGILAMVLVLPVTDEVRGQLLSLLGILLSAAIALSSTTVLSNLLAGIMIRSARSFRIGDFITVGEHFGRVSARGLFHVEIQTEQRELTTIPHAFFLSNPVTTVRSSGAIITASVSLGYDYPRPRIEALLLEAADDAGLEETFVHIVELGDFSVSYRVSGLLAEVKRLISARSQLRAAIMDSLHADGVEVVSPNFINSRVLPEDRHFIPPVESAAEESDNGEEAEVRIFDKAEEAEMRENQLIASVTDLEMLEDEIAAAEERDVKERLIQKRDNLQEQIKSLQSSSADAAEAGIPDE